MPISQQCIARHRSSLIAETKIPFKTYENIPVSSLLFRATGSRDNYTIAICSVSEFSLNNIFIFIRNNNN